MPWSPGPDDPRYWERLRKGPPLDEWVDIKNPAYRARMEAKMRREDLHFRIFCWVVGLALAAGLIWSIATADSTPDPREDGYGICQDERGAYEC